MLIVPSLQLVLLLVPQDMTVWYQEHFGSEDLLARLDRLANWNFQPSHQLKLLHFCAQ